MILNFKIYNFDDGRALEPDFVLFLSNSKEEPSVYYQVFIEPKGQHLLVQDKWKEDFLKKLKDENRIEQLWKNREYTIWGMPFYNEVQRISEFSLEVETLLNGLNL